MLDHLDACKRFYNRSILGYIDLIDRDKNSPFYGTIPNCWNNLNEGSYYFTTLIVLVQGYYLTGSPLYRKKEYMDLAYETLVSLQRFIHEDGSMDMKTTNFHDPAFVAFSVRDSLGPLVAIMDKYTLHTEEEDRMFALACETLRKLSNPIKHLGFHTANHRWLISCALSYVYKYLKDDEALEVINRFLSEGIDCDENGEYTERSSGTYNMVCDEAFYVLGDVLGDPSFFEPVCRNLRLMHSFFEPDETIFTDSSLRQDHGKRHIMDEYYHFFLVMALVKHDGEFAYYADRIFRHTLGNEMKTDNFGGIDLSLLNWYLLHPEWEDIQADITPVKPTRDRNIFLEKSGLARIYCENTTLSVIKSHRENFLKFQFGDTFFYLRCASSFFGQPHSQFRAAELKRDGDSFVLSSEEQAGYRSQFDTPPETSDYHLMDHSKRHLINVHTLDTNIRITPKGRGFSMDVMSSGTPDVPIKIDILLPAKGRFESEGVFTEAKAGFDLLLRGDCRMVYNQMTSLYIKCPKSEHYYYREMRGTDPVPDEYFTLTVTGYSYKPMHFEFYIDRY